MSSKRTKVEVGFRTITPDDARQMLAESKRRNRKPLVSKLKEFAVKMAEGKWNPHNSQAVSRDWDRNIVNGHTRLLACIEANTPFTTLFMDGVDPAAFAEEDTGRSRNSADFFVISGVNDYAKAGVMAAACRVMELYDRGLYRYAGNPRLAYRNSASLVTNDQLAAVLDRRPVIRKATDYVFARRRLLKAFPTGFMAALWALTHGNKAHDPFWGELAEGLNIGKDSPVRQLRLRVAIADAKNHKIKSAHLVALTTKTWNTYQAGETIGKLMFFHGKGESFPEPVSRLKPAFPDYVSKLAPPAPPADEEPKKAEAKAA